MILTLTRYKSVVEESFFSTKKLTFPKEKRFPFVPDKNGSLPIMIWMLNEALPILFYPQKFLSTAQFYQNFYGYIRFGEKASLYTICIGIKISDAYLTNFLLPSV